MRLQHAFLLTLVAFPVALAQQSTSYRVEEHVFNAGGRPAAGESAHSSSFRVSMDALGEGVLGGRLTSASFHVDGGFGAAYPPPGEVHNLHFVDEGTLAWDPNAGHGPYNLYRDRMTSLTGTDYGQCHERNIASESASDTESPPPARGFFYLVTAENRLDEEGPMGWDSAGGARPNSSPCP